MLNRLWLNTFANLVETGHFTKTAEKLFMTQPGVSQHVRKLEQACGHALIQRDNKQFELTEQGRLVYQYAQKLTKSEHELLESLAFDEPFKGLCNIACSGALALNLYPRLLALQEQHRQLVIHLRSAPNHQILSEVQQGIVDLGVVTDVPNQHLFEVRPLGQDQLCLLLPSSVDIQQCSGALLHELGLISHPDAQHYLSLYFAQNQDAQFKGLNISELPVSGFVNQINQILQPVAQGLGFTVLPKSAYDCFYQPELLQILEPERPVMESLFVVNKKNRTLPARITTVTNLLLECFD